MIEITKAADRYSICDGALAVEFLLSKDRWRHSVSISGADGELLVLNSVEGRPEEVPLPSPAFQELQFEEMAGGIVEFQLFGRSGKVIYSAAVRYESNTHSLEFDLCARGPHSDLAPLCTFNTYTWGGPIAPRVETTNSTEILVLNGDCGNLHIEAQSGPFLAVGACRWIDSSPAKIIVGDQETSRPNSLGKSISVRWKHVWSFGG